MKTKLRYLIAVLLNRSRRNCWADLVVWAQYGDPGTPPRGRANNCGRPCYCGKFKEETA